MSEGTVSAILLTLKVASLSTFFVMIPGVFLAYYFSRRDTQLSRFVFTLMGLPMVLPPTAVGYLLLRMLATDGPFGDLITETELNLLLTWKAAVIAAAVMSIPIVLRTAKVAFDNVDPKLEMMARTLGHGRFVTFFKTTLPLAKRGLLAAVILGFTRAVGEFGATVTIAGNIPFRTQTLASAIFSAQQVGQHKEAYILISIALFLGFFAIFATELLSRKTSVINPRS